MTTRAPSQGDPQVSGRDHDLRRRFLEVAIDAVEDAVLGLDGDGRVTTANRATTRLSGRDPLELVGEQLPMLFAAHCRDGVSRALGVALVGGRTDLLEAELVRRDGMSVPVLLSVHPVPGPGGGVAAGAAILRDLTERHVTQARLAETEALVREAEAIACTGSWIWDVRTGAVQWSEMFHHLCGVDPLAFEGTFGAHMAVVHPDDRGRVGETLRSALATGRPVDVSYRVLLPDGAERWLETRATPTRDSGGSVVGLRGVARVSHTGADGTPVPGRDDRRVGPASPSQ